MATTEIATLSAGDYALAQDTERVPGRKTLAVRFAIERKELNDFLSTISTGWERFQRELVRMEAFPARVVIVESDIQSVCFAEELGVVIAPQHNHPGLSPLFVSRRVAELTLQNVSVLFAGNATLAAGLAYRIFKRRAEMWERIPL